MKNFLFPGAIILFASIIISIPFLQPGLFQIHDDQQIVRLFLFDQALRNGQFPVRWVDELGFGFGYPLFVFYPPLVYMLGEIFHFLGFGFVDSVKLIFFTGIFSSGLAMYILAKSFWGKLPAIVAALFYLLVPYRALDVYVRGALAESFSFVWLPLILWSFYQLAQTAKFKYLLTSALLLALLMITHNLIFLPFMLLLPIYLLFLIFNSKGKLKFIVSCFLSLVIAFGLSAFFWIPALIEKKLTIVDDLLLVSLADYKIHFVYSQQLWNWTWGFGGSSEGLADGISFKIGKIHILVSIVAFIITIIHILKHKASRQLLALRSPSGLSLRVEDFSEVGSIVFFVLFLLSAFMTTFYSKFIWDIVKPLQYLQFPWRFLIFTALFSSSLAASFVYFLKLPILKLISSFLLIILLMMPNIKLFRPQTYRLNLTDETATEKELINWEISQSSFEYVPKGVKLYKSNLGTNLVDINKSELPQKKVEVISGVAAISNLTSKPHTLTFNIGVEEGSKLKVNIFNFPGWQARIDGVKVPIDDDNNLKLITLNVPKGYHQVGVQFKNNPIRSVANSISLLSMMFLTFLIIKKWKAQTTH